MKTIITKDLSSTQTPAPGKQLQVAPDGESFAYVDAGINQIVAGSNMSVSRVGNTVTIASSGGGGGGQGSGVDPDTNNLISVTDNFLFADKRSSAHTYDNTSSGIVSTNVQGAIDELKGTDDVIQDSIIAINGTISDIQTDVSTVQGDITTLQGDITTLQGDITTLSSNKLETVTDTLSVNLTKTGANLSADVTLNIDPTQLIEVTSTGLLADKRASAHSYDGTVSGLTATNVQVAIDQVKALIGSGNNNSVTLIAGENIPQGNAVYVNLDGLAYNAYQGTGFIGIATDTVTVGQSLVIQYSDIVSTYLSTLTTGLKYYIEPVGLWNTGANLPAVRNLQGYAQYNGKAYAVGGDTSSVGSFTGTNYEYDMATNIWSTKAPCPILTNGMGGAEVGGKLYFMGGIRNGNIVNNFTYEYDPSTDTWTQKANIAGGAREAGAVIANAGLIYYISGRDGSGSYITNIYSYNPSTNTWNAALSPMPVVRAYSAVAAYNNFIYNISGRSTGGSTTEVYRYNVSTNTWAYITDIPVGVIGAVAKVIGNSIYVFGGNTNNLGGGSGNYQSLVQIYNIDDNTWSTGVAMPTARQWMGIAKDQSNIFIYGGYNNAGALTVNEIYHYGPSDPNIVTTNLSGELVGVAINSSELLIK